jgi:hypothetical protein
MAPMACAAISPRMAVRLKVQQARDARYYARRGVVEEDGVGSRVARSRTCCWRSSPSCSSSWRLAAVSCLSARSLTASALALERVGLFLKHGSDFFSKLTKPLIYRLHMLSK